MKTIMITGVCGVGKSTITRQLAAQLKLPWNDYADFMLEYMKDGDRDIFPRLTWQERRELYTAVDGVLANRLMRAKTHNLYLLENHLTVIHDGEIIPLDFAPYDQYRLAGIISVEGDPEVIAKRRINDIGRLRVNDDAKIIARQQEMNREILKALSGRFNIPSKTILNHEDPVVDKKLIGWIEELTERKD